MGQGIPLTNLESAPATLTNYPSSVVNGITSEGGLSSLTFKLVTCAELVQNLDFMRNALVGENPDAVTVYDGLPLGETSFRDTLQQEIAQLKNDTAVPDFSAAVDSLRTKLDDAINTREFHGVAQDIQAEYESRNPGKTVLIDMKLPLHLIKIPGAKVDEAPADYHSDSQVPLETVVIAAADPQPEPEPLTDLPPQLEQLIDPHLDLMAVDGPLVPPHPDLVLDPQQALGDAGLDDDQPMLTF